MLPKSIIIYKALDEYMGSWEFTINRKFNFKVYTFGVRTVTLFGEAEVTQYFSLGVCNSIDDKLHKFCQALYRMGYNQIRNDISNRT